MSNWRDNLVWLHPVAPFKEIPSIGFDPDERKWYGWSDGIHCGFGIGSKVSDEGKKGYRTIGTLEEAREAAESFVVMMRTVGAEEVNLDIDYEPPKKRRGRPPGSKNKKKVVHAS